MNGISRRAKTLERWEEILLPSIEDRPADIGERK